MVEESKNKLRFAPLVRVSTESQEKRGSSLEVQAKALKQAVKTLGGTIPKNCEEYFGQEYATANYERQILDKLLSDVYFRPACVYQNKFPHEYLKRG